MESSVPVPKPRPSPFPRLDVVDGNIKKPIPKPRLRILKDVDSESIRKGTVTGVREAETINSENKEINFGKSSFSSLKEENKRSSENVLGKGRHVLDGTRTVGARLEKSVRKITRRLTVRPASPAREATVTSPKLVRSQSLPSEDIFQSISFNSPLVNENESNETLVESEEVGDDVEKYVSAPPPVYPPPPLPDETLYDEVQSVISSHSGNSVRSMNATHTETDAEYEPVAIVSRTFGKPRPAILSHVTNSDSGDAVLCSESWTYHDVAPGDNGDINDASSDIYVNSKDSASFISGRTHSCSSISPSLLSELDAISYVSGEDMFDDEHSGSSPARSSTSQSVSVQNELYGTWDPKTVSLAIRQNEGRKLPSKSVILEFDPLFDNTAQDSRSHSKSEELMFGLSSSQERNPIKYSPYGKIKRTVKQITIDEFEGKEEVLTPPPIPPRRTDSISHSAVEKQLVLPQVENTDDLVIRPHKVIQVYNADDVEYHLVNPGDENVSELPPSRPVSRGDSREESPSKQRRNLVRWDSILQKVKFVTDARPTWSPSMIRRNGRSTTKEQQPDINVSSAVEEGTIVQRPEIPNQTRLSHTGVMYKMALNKERTQDHVQRWCMLGEGKLNFYTDKTGSGVREIISLSNILSVHVVLDQKLGTDGDCFEINTTCKGRNFVFGTSGTSERRVWMQKILESMTNVFPLRIISDFTRAGWCFLKEGISGVWAAAWILIHRRMLYYCFQSGGIQEVDLRKVRCIVLQEEQKDVAVLKTTEKGPVILVDCQGQALYMQMDTNRETASWQKDIRAAAVDNGPNLAQQQLTKDDIPVIVDKCIRFVYAHGSMSQGIYRRSGTNSSVTRLLELFRLDAFAVQLSHPHYTEYDVSSVLKRFFRDLPEPLLTTELHGQFCDIAAGKCGKDHVALYRRTLEQLPPINFLTARKLIGHLHFIHKLHEENLMPVENLAALWGPTLMHLEINSASEPYEQSRLETAAVAELILMYPQLFEVDAEERKREQQIQDALFRIAPGNNAPQNKQSGELHVWIYLENRASADCVNITVGPQKTAGEVCTDLAGKTKWPVHELGLEEVICGGSLVRMLHYSEKVLDTVLRWAYWDEADRKDNALVLRRNELYREVLPLARPPLAMCAELRYADQKKSSFKTFLFEFSQAKLCCYKDKRGSVKMREWNIEDIIWYVGYETKRNPQTRWAITFIEKSKRGNSVKITFCASGRWKRIGAIHHR